MSLDENATVVSIDGVGAFDLISRNAIVWGLMAVEHGDGMWPFIRESNGRPSSYLWEDDRGVTHDISQEGGEQRSTHALLLQLGSAQEFEVDL